MKGRARAFGAVTIVNAISIGKGAAMGIELFTEAEVEVCGKNIEVDIEGNPNEDKSLARIAVAKVLKLAGIDQGAYVYVKSNIPIGKGLKSSSAAANAIVLATLKAVGLELDDKMVLDIAVDAAIDAGVTITGAYDDACASYFGGIVLTDNLNRRLIRRVDAPIDLSVVILVPEWKIYTKSFNKKILEPIAPLVDIAFKLAVDENYWESMLLNGILHASAIGVNPKKIVDAIVAGAISAGLSGTGPSIVALCKDSKVDDVISVLKEEGCDIIVTKPNNRKALVLG